MDHITIASASVPLSHRHRDNDGYIERSIWPRSKWLKSWCPQIRRIIIFIYFPFGAHTIWEILPKVYESTWKNIWKFLDEIFNLKENGDFSQFRKILVCGEWQPIPGEEVPLAQYCAETGFRTNLPEIINRDGKILHPLSILVKSGTHKQHTRMVVGIKWVMN